MKKSVCFLLGAVVGVVATLLVMFLISSSADGKVLFDEAGECLSTNRFEVSEVVDDSSALAYELVYDADFGYMTSSLQVLVTNDDDESYSDKQVIKVPKGKGMRQVGVYRYNNKSGEWKVVPIVKLMDR